MYYLETAWRTQICFHVVLRSCNILCGAIITLRHNWRLRKCFFLNLQFLKMVPCYQTIQKHNRKIDLHYEGEEEACNLCPQTTRAPETKLVSSIPEMLRHKINILSSQNLKEMVLGLPEKVSETCLLLPFFLEFAHLISKTNATKCWNHLQKNRSIITFFSACINMLM